MIFVFHLIDSPDSAAPRAEFMAQHKAYIAAVADRIAFAGPLVGDDGKATAGSLLAIDFADRAAADQWIAGEPFTRAGVYAKTSIHGFLNRWAQKAGFPAT